MSQTENITMQTGEEAKQKRIRTKQRLHNLILYKYIYIYPYLYFIGKNTILDDIKKHSNYLDFVTT